jgi:branched-chain amino acid aminotransferase
MKSAIHTYYIHNGQPVDRRYFLCDTSEGTDSVYEVIRLVEGVPLFLEDHFFRMERSAHLIGRTLYWTMADIEHSIRRLAESNRVLLGNVKLMVQWDEEDKGEMFACFIPHRYPTPQELSEGVAVSFLEAQRDNPNAKVQNASLRELTDRLMEERNVYEVLLTDASGNISEGSRSNFFLINDGELITAPLASVLPGITRGKVLEIAYARDFTVRQRPIHREELREAQAAFLTGTSPGVLPIARIDDLAFSVDLPLLRQLQTAFQAMVRRYVQSHNSVLA